MVASGLGMVANLGGMSPTNPPYHPYYGNAFVSAVGQPMFPSPAGEGNMAPVWHGQHAHPQPVPVPPLRL